MIVILFGNHLCVVDERGLPACSWSFYGAAFLFCYKHSTASGKSLENLLRLYLNVYLLSRLPAGLACVCSSSRRREFIVFYTHTQTQHITHNDGIIIDIVFAIGDCG